MIQRLARRATPALVLLLASAVTACNGGSGVLAPVDPNCPVETVFFGGSMGLVEPRLIDSSKVQPAYPDDARTERIEGRVILGMHISSVGAVCELQVLSVEPPGWGFETAAVTAVEQWRYEPATLSGTPVASYFTVFVEFLVH